MKAETQAFRDLLFDLLKQKLMKTLIGKLPFLGLPILNPIVGWGMGWIIGQLLDNSVLGINRISIDLIVNSDVKNVEKKRDTAREAALGGDAEKIKQADEELENAARDLFRLGRSPL